MLASGNCAGEEDFMAEVFKSLSVASPDGSSAPFDKDSRGLAYCCACLVLKRLDDALRDGDEARMWLNYLSLTMTAVDIS